MEGMSASGNHDLLGAHSIINDFELQDFIDDANFYQFVVDLIRGENEDPAVAHFESDLISGSCFVDDNNQFGSATPGSDHSLGLDHDTSFVPNPAAPFLTTLPHFDGEVNDIEDADDGEDSGGTTATTTTNTTVATTTKPKADRSRTLVSERKRRGEMKEKLYVLRSLVPNITKMDKASIVGDAVQYVQGLQKHAKELEAEISGLEASIEGSGGKQAGSTQYPTKKNLLGDSYHLIPKGIFQMDVSQVEENGYYVKVGCNKGAGVATALYMAIESLTSFNILSSNLNTINSRSFELALALNVKESERQMINLSNLKLWVTGAFLNQGLELATGF